MRFYYENNIGDSGSFSEKDLVKAIYTAWNIDAILWLVPTKDKIKRNDMKSFYENTKLIFSPLEDNEFNSDILKEHGYKMIDSNEFREIAEIETGRIVKYDWSEVKQLI